MSLVFGSQLATKRSKRSAVVPYTILPATTGGWEIWFLLGFDADSGQITDFGGGIKKFETDSTGGYREFLEETKYVLKNAVSLNDLQTCVAAVADEPGVSSPRNTSCIGSTSNIQDTWGAYGGMSVFFAPVGNEWFQKASSTFDSISMEGNSHNEISGLIWFRENDFVKLFRNPEASEHDMWPRLRKFYSTIYSKELHDLLYIRYWWFMPNFAIERNRTVNKCIRRTVVTTTVQYQLGLPR